MSSVDKAFGCVQYEEVSKAFGWIVRRRAVVTFKELDEELFQLATRIYPLTQRFLRKLIHSCDGESFGDFKL